MTQTCFQGRFGEETGSDQFGVHIMIHGHKKSELNSGDPQIVKGMSLVAQR